MENTLYINKEILPDMSKDGVIDLFGSTVEVGCGGVTYDSNNDTIRKNFYISLRVEYPIPGSDDVFWPLTCNMGREEAIQLRDAIDKALAYPAISDEELKNMGIFIREMLGK